jgi:hypothetical protein
MVTNNKLLYLMKEKLLKVIEYKLQVYDNKLREVYER